MSEKRSLCLCVKYEAVLTVALENIPSENKRFAPYQAIHHVQAI